MMFSQKLRSPYMESPVGLSSGFFRPEYTQYNTHWDGADYEPHTAFDNESDTALSRIYTLGEDKPMLLSPLMPEQLARMGMYTPDMKPQPRLDDLELQVLSSAPSELSSWSENEEKASLVKYESESSLEHLHSIHFSPEQFSNCGSKLNFNYATEGGYNQDNMHALSHGRPDPYHLGWRYFEHDSENAQPVDLTEMVDGVFPGSAVPTRLDHDLRPLEIPHQSTKVHGANICMPIGLRNALKARRSVFRSTNDENVNKTSFKRKKDDEHVMPPAEDFLLQPWPINDGLAIVPSAPKSHEVNASLRVPIPCLSATERWEKHTERYVVDPKPSGDMVCTHCDQTFTDVGTFTTHLDEEKVVHDNFCPDMSCPFAALGFRYRWLLRRHICNHHLKDYNNKKLRKNSVSPGEKNSLTDNFLSHVYVCKKKNCSRAFYRSDSLSRHEKLIHSVGSKQKRKERLRLGKCDPKIFE